MKTMPLLRALVAGLELTGSIMALGDTVLFQDDFGPAGTGPGTNWISVPAGYPDAVDSRILDGTRSVLRMRCTDITPAQQRGIETSHSISIASVTNDLHVDLGFSPRTGGNSSATLELIGMRGNVRVFTQDWVPRQVTTDGAGTGGSFSTNSGGAAYSFYGYYHFILDVYSNATTIAFLSDDQQTVFWRCTTDKLGLGDLGNSVALRIYQVTGAGIVENFIDSVTVASSTNTTQYLSGALALNSIPEPWRVHYVVNRSNTLVTMYTSGGETLAEYQNYVGAMQTTVPKGLGNAFDPGPAIGGSYQAPLYQYLAGQGYPSIAWSVPFRTGAISLDDQNLLKILDAAGLFTSVQFGEWGYHFHVDKPYGPYDGYPQPMTNRVQCYNSMKSAYLQQAADYRRGWANSVTGHSHYECYAAEWGCRMSGIEVGENIAFTQSKIAFSRGASRQWDIPWSLQMSPWWSGYCTCWNTPDYGHSLSLYQRMLLHGWFAGAAWLTPENSSNIDFSGGSPTNGVNSWGAGLAQVYAFVRSHDRGTPYTPIAVVLDHYAGYNGYAHKSWGTLPFTPGDMEIDDLFVSQLYPGSDFIHYDPFPENREKGYLRETPNGEMFDVLLSSVTLPKLSSYPVILLAGDMTFDAPWVSVLQQALQQGSRLLMQPEHRTALGSNYSLLASAGTVEVLPPWTNLATGRAAVIPNWRLHELSTAYAPIAVSGDPVQYSFCRSPAGWVVELVHDSGVWKDPSNAAVTTPTDTASVSLKPCVPVAGARLWGIDAGGNASDTNLNYTGTPLTVQVGPGQSVYVEFTLLPIKLLAWLQYYYPMASDYPALARSDTDGDGMTAEEEYVAGTNPTNRTSVLRIVDYHRSAGSSTLSWSAVTNRLYAVWQSTNLLHGWTSLTNGVWGLPAGTNSFEMIESGDSMFFYRVGVSTPP